MNGMYKTPAMEHLFSIDDEAENFSDEKAQLFLVGKILYLCTRTHQDIQMALVFLCTRVMTTKNW